MSGWAKKRFWTEATIAPNGHGFEIKLDGRSVRTPAKSLLQVPTRALAEAIAAEWQAQDKEIDPLSMPFTRTANAAIDKVAAQQGDVADMLAAYGGTDLLCYRADSPEELVKRQAAAWDPILKWAAEHLEAPLQTTQGIVHIPQPLAALDALSKRVHAMDPFALAGFHDLVCMSGSLVLAFAVAENRLEAGEAWSLSRIDETWQEEQWGVDEEAARTAQTKQAQFDHAKQVLDLLQGSKI